MTPPTESTQTLVDNGVSGDSIQFSGVGGNEWLSLLLGALPFVLFLGLWIFLINQMQGGGSKVMSFGKSRAKRMAVDSPKITFKDVAGADEAVEELHEIKEFLENPKKFQALGARIPKGVLLYGPPGTGKTLLARAVAGEAGVPFFSISGSDFVEMFVGVGASRVRDLFEQAKQNAPCIIFMDEIDAVGRHRGAGLGGGHDHALIPYVNSDFIYSALAQELGLDRRRRAAARLHAVRRARDEDRPAGRRRLLEAARRRASRSASRSRRSSSSAASCGYPADRDHAAVRLVRRLVGRGELPTARGVAARLEPGQYE